jgi:hypothetical protein
MEERGMFESTTYYRRELRLYFLLDRAAYPKA